MTAQALNVGDEFGRLIAEGSISMQALTAITGIAPARLKSLLDLDLGLSAAANDFSEDEILRVSTLAGQLTVGAEIGDYERIRAIVETLTTQFELTHENIARLTRIRVEDLEAFFVDPDSVPWEAKFAMASDVRGETTRGHRELGGFGIGLALRPVFVLWIRCLGPVWDGVPENPQVLAAIRPERLRRPVQELLASFAHTDSMAAVGRRRIRFGSIEQDDRKSEPQLQRSWATASAQFARPARQPGLCAQCGRLDRYRRSTAGGL
ncbi:HTH domain-containing protein [Leifsonia sp. NPDC014704]|uniref:HTH domain-containing protein n=1 Tax=Leifsonia sp. NPDC014704 TaxID=3364123 RepID=UPI0036F498A2